MTNSAPSSKAPSKRLLPRPAVGFTALFAFLGFADAAYLTADHYLGFSPPCSLTDGCETVLSSSYAVFGSIPLAMMGAAYYLVALCLAVYVYTATAEDARAARRAAMGVWILSGLGLIASAFLVYIQLAVLEAICIYCMGSALTTLLLFISSSVLVYQRYRSQRS